MGSIEVIAVPAEPVYKFDEPMEGIPLSPGFDDLHTAIGLDGLPRGRLVELLGPKKSGKTALALFAVRGAQTQGGVAAFVDLDKTVTPYFATCHGVDCSTFMLSSPDTGEQAMDVLEALIHSGQFSLVVVNGLDKLAPRAREGDPPDYTNYPGRTMSRAIRTLAAKAHQTGTCVVFIHDTMGVLDKTPARAGNPLRFYASLRIQMGRIDQCRVKCKVLKNKFAPPFATAEVDL